jgi:hypothetical protein
LFREVGDPFDEAEILTHPGDARNADGDARRARDAWQQAPPGPSALPRDAPGGFD